jgi:hypothetical protein
VAEGLVATESKAISATCDAAWRIRRPDRELRPECRYRYVGLTGAILVFVLAADTREGLDVGTRGPWTLEAQ